MFRLCKFTKIVLDGWCINSPDANFRRMFGHALTDLSLRNWQLPDSMSEKYIIEDEDDYFFDKGYVIDPWAKLDDFTADISGCDKHTASCLFSRFMYGYRWKLKFVIDEHSEAKIVYDSFIKLLKENESFSYEDRHSERRKEYISRLYKSPFFDISGVDDMDFACDGYWEDYLDPEDWRIQTCFEPKK